MPKETPKRGPGRPSTKRSAPASTDRTENEAATPAEGSETQSMIGETQGIKLALDTANQQVGFLRNHYSALAQRYAALKVDMQQMDWNGASAWLQGELNAVSQQLSGIAQQVQGQSQDPE